MTYSKQVHNNKITIPSSLIYETMDGKDIYYTDYQKVISGKKQLSEIIGSSSLQGLIIQILTSYLYENNHEENYLHFSNEIGIRISKKDNVSCDLIIFEQLQLESYKFDDKYFNIAPKIVLEVDVKADVANEGTMEYINRKTQKLLNFGVEKVIWVLSKNQKIIIATPNNDWIMRDWARSFEIFDNVPLNLKEELKKKGYKY